MTVSLRKPVSLTKRTVPNADTLVKSWPVSGPSFMLADNLRNGEPMPGYGSADDDGGFGDGQVKRTRSSKGRHAEPVSVCPRYDMPSRAPQYPLDPADPLHAMLIRLFALCDLPVSGDDEGWAATVR